MPDQIVLDPVEVSTGRQQLDITPWVKAEGADYGDAEIAAVMADMQRGSVPTDFRLPNRQIVLPLNMKTVSPQPGAGSGGGTTIAWTYAQGRAVLQQKVARIQQEGGWIRRSTSSGTLFADVVNATLRFGGDWMQGRTNAPVDINAELHLECIPDWYKDEITLPDHVETTNRELIWTENNIQGNYPGRVRLVVDDDQGQNQQGLLWGVRCRHFSNSTTAALVYGGAQLTPLDSAALSGGTSINHPSLSTNWTPVCSTDQVATGASLTHTGTYRVWVSTSTALPVAGATPSRLRLVWDVGDFALPTENAPVQIPGFGAVYPVDLGEVRLDRVPAGTHRWRGVVQAAGPVGGEGVSVNRMWLVPVDEGYGVLRAPTNVDPGLNSYLARDEFNQTAGSLAGKTMPVGGTWAGAGSSVGVFNVDATNHVVTRSSLSDPTPRFELAGSATPAAVVVTASMSHSAVGGGDTGVVARWVDVNNYLALRLQSLNVGNQTIVQLTQVVGGVTTVLLDTLIGHRMLSGAFLTARLAVDAAGRWSAFAGPAGAVALLGQGISAVLATGGTLDDGRIGIFDRYPVSTLLIRTVDNFAAWVPQQDAVLFAGQSAELRTEGMFREDPTGTAFGPVSYVTGDLPRIPPSGAESRTVQFFVKASRGDFGSLPDTGTDDISARLAYRPSYLLTA